jgi:hypothetical protein
MSIFYQYGPEKPFHLSVGAVVFNEKFEICTHRFFRGKVPERLRFLMGDLKEGYHLARETVENDETLHQAVHRGIKEEFGAEGVIEKYLGSVVCQVQTPTTIFEKTTLYHAVRLTTLGERTGTDEESESVLEWYKPAELLELYRKQVAMTDRPELDETSIIERFITAYRL